MKLYSTLTALGLGVVLLGFQNCTKTAFTASSSSAKSLQSLVPTDSTNTASSTTDPKQPVAPPADSSGTPVPVAGDTGSSCDGNSVSGDEDHSGHHSPHDGVGADSSKSHSSDDDEVEKDDDFVVCILKDSGKSMKLGMLSEDLGGANSVAQAVCVSRKECLGNVAKSFEVEGAEDRAYCKHNPNVEHLSDDEVDKLLAVETTPPAPTNL